MTNVQLLQLAQQTAATVVAGNLTPFGVVKAEVAAFSGTGNPDTDWPSFNKVFQTELLSYRQAAARDSAPVGSAGNPGIPASVAKNLPPDIAARFAARAAAPAPVAAAAASTAPA